MTAHVTHIESNAKSGVRADLGPMTLVIGDNWSGKSSVIASVELALTGRCAEVGAAPAAIMEMAPDGDPIQIRAALSDGREIAFRVAGSTASARKPLWSVGGAPVGDPLGVVLNREVADLLARDPKRQREALLAITCGAVDTDAIAARVPDAFRAEWDRIWRSVASGGIASADALVAAVEAIRAELRTARAGAKIEVIGPRPDAPSENAIAELRREVGSAQAAIAARSTRDAALRELPALHDRLATLRAVRDGDVRGGDDDPAVIRRALEVLGGAETIACADPGSCPACGGAEPAGGWPDRSKAIRALRDDLAITLQAVLRCPAAADIDRIAARIAELERAATIPTADDVPDDALAVVDRLRDAEAARAQVAAWDSAIAGAQRGSDRAIVLEALAKTADRIVAESLGQAIDAFCDRATVAIDGQRVAVQLHDGARQVCRVGLATARGVVRSWRVLSGAERVILLSGFATAWGAARTEAVRLVAVDEVALRRGLPDLCAALGRAIAAGALTQAIVCCVDAHGADGPLAEAGWRVVRL